MCCSTDGTVTAALFTPAELGMAMNSNEMEALKQERYGDMRGRKLVVPQTAALKALKEAGDKNLRVPDILRKPASGGLKAPLRGEGSLLILSRRSIFAVTYLRPFSL